MLAWILNTTPLNLGSSGFTTRWIAARAGRRRQVHQRVQHLAHAEVVDGRAEEHRRLVAGQEPASSKAGTRPAPARCRGGLLPLGMPKRSA
jgi:hypothetical protein